MWIEPFLVLQIVSSCMELAHAILEKIVLESEGKDLKLVDAPVSGRVKRAAEGSTNLVSLINEVLDQAKIESGKIEIEAVQFDLRTILDNVLSLFSGKSQEKGVELAVYISENVPQKLIGDPGRFRQIITNLMGNSIKLFAYDTVNKQLSHKPGEQPKLPLPASLVAGACAGVSSTICTYPLELVKTQLTVQRGVYDGMFDAFLKIVRDEGPAELYRGLASSLIRVIPYAATNYFAHDTSRKAYWKFFKEEKIGNIKTLLIGSLAGAISSSATFPLEVARKHMQVGPVSGRQVYKNVVHALASILEQEGVGGLYRGLGPSCMKLVPAAGISFMCYEACKRILVEDDEEA
ncbi:hypothetical protein ACJRO7_028317 [Eucalyptus globulus]|uniref:Uncharacterized protein n=1 Tax=Eucalyptus globulus TaxID=34317 RepID=A0ABD3JU44_EUCGL